MKDELLNDILDRFKEEGISFEKDAANSEGVYFTQVVTNALWYVTSHHLTINDASKKQANVLPIPDFFQRNLVGCPRGVKVKCFNTFVRSTLEYGCSVWDPHQA